MDNVEKMPVQGEQGGQDGGDVLMEIGNALNSIAEGAKGSSMPPEAAQLFGQARDSFNEAVKIIAGGGAPAQPMAENQARGSVPAQ